MVPKPRMAGRPPKVPIERPPDPEYWTVDEFCVLLAISRSSWPRHRPYLKTIQVGQRVLIKRAEVRRYIDSLERPAQKARHAPPSPI
jgi:hypothetical protein